VSGIADASVCHFSFGSRVAFEGVDRAIPHRGRVQFSEAECSDRCGRPSRGNVVGIFGGRSGAGVVSGAVPGCTTRTIDVMPSPTGDRESSGDAADRPAPSDVNRRECTVEVPSTPPVLTSGAAAALVRVLLKAGRSCSEGTVPDDGEPDVLASSSG